MKKGTLIEIIAMSFVLLFVYTALSKIFLYSIYQYDLGRSPGIQKMSPVLSIVLPAAELIVSALLIFDRTRKAGMWSAFGLMSAFTGYVWYVLNLGIGLPCTCGGLIRQLTWRQHFVFNIFFVLLSALGLWLLHRKHRNNADRRTSASGISDIQNKGLWKQA